MKKVIKLTENDLERIVKRVLNEQPKPPGPDIKKDSTPNTSLNFSQMKEVTTYNGCSVQKHHKNILRVNCPKDNIFFDAKLEGNRL